jgi:hypothetical protein
MRMAGTVQRVRRVVVPVGRVLAAVFCLLALSSCGGGGAPPRSVQIGVEVRDGEAVGGVQRHDIPLDSEVTITARSDVPNFLHAHGYPATANVEAGVPASITFVADQPGVFEVHMHLTDTMVAELAIS